MVRPHFPLGNQWGRKIYNLLTPSTHSSWSFPLYWHGERLPRLLVSGSGGGGLPLPTISWQSSSVVLVSKVKESPVLLVTNALECENIFLNYPRRSLGINLRSINPKSFHLNSCHVHIPCQFQNHVFSTLARPAPHSSCGQPPSPPQLR